MRHPAHAFLLLLPLLLSACDQLGIESTTALAARREAEGKAVGAGCRHAARSVEVCYGTNKKADKAAVFAGWREMNDYMRENKIEAVMPQVSPPTTGTKAAAESDEAAKIGPAVDKRQDRRDDKSADKPTMVENAKPRARETKAPAS